MAWRWDDTDEDWLLLSREERARRIRRDRLVNLAMVCVAVVALLYLATWKP